MTYRTEGLSEVIMRELMIDNSEEECTKLSSMLTMSMISHEVNKIKVTKKVKFISYTYESRF